MSFIFDKIQALLMSQDPANITLALEIAKGQGISAAEVWEPWMELLELSRAWDNESIEDIFGRLFEEDLQLSQERLKILPEQLQKLTPLKHLNVTQNELVQLPDWIGDLRNLETFTAHHNLLEVLPNSFTSLSKLKVLNLEANALSALPEKIGLLSNLQELCLHHNPLIYIPESFGQLQQLELLDLPAVALLYLPTSIKALQQLKEVYINDYFSFLQNASKGIQDQSAQKVTQLRRLLPRCLITF